MPEANGGAEGNAVTYDFRQEFTLQQEFTSFTAPAEKARIRA